MTSSCDVACLVRRTRANQVRAGLAALALTKPLVNAPGSPFPQPSPAPPPPPPPSPITQSILRDYSSMSPAGDRDEPMASTSHSPADMSDDSDNSMQLDSDVDMKRNTDVDAEGEEVDEDEVQLSPKPNGHASSYMKNRAVCDRV